MTKPLTTMRSSDAGQSRRPPAAGRAKKRPAALSPAQLAMVRRYLAEPESYCNFEFQHITLCGEVEPERLYAAWQSVLARYPILHSALEWDPASGEPRQIFLDGPPPIRLLRPEGETEAFPALLERRRRYRVNPRRGLFELLLLAGNRQTDMLVNTHHMVYDGWSTGVILDALLREYRAAGGRPLPPVPPAASFEEFAAFQRRSDPAPLREFYRRMLAGYAAPPRHCAASPVGFGSKSSLESFLSLPAPLLRAAAGRLQATPASMFTALWAREAMRLYGRADVVVGVVFSCRGLPIPGLDRCVGPLLNVLPLRVRRAPAEDMVRSVHRALTALQELQHIPFDYPALDGLPRLSIDSVALFQNYPALPDAESEGLRLVLRESVYFPDNEITFEIRPQKEGAALFYRYDNRRFTKEQIEASARRVSREAAALCQGAGSLSGTGTPSKGDL